MLRRRARTWLILTLALTAATCRSAQTANKSPNKVSFEIGPVPSWVKPIEPGSDVGVAADNAGMVYLLADRQENLQENAFYFHEVRKITSENGRKNGASVSAPFDPAFEKLIFHSIKLTHNGTASNRLDRSRIKLLQRETDPERSIYDASLTAQITLGDLRVGDVIEFAFSREGANPWRRGKFATSYLLQWEAPIARNIVRIVYPATRTLLSRAENAGRG